MAEDVKQAIARYLKKIHEELVRPVLLEASGKKYRPDRLVLFQEAFMRSYFRSESLFKKSVKAASAMECQADEDCNPNEKCIYGECVPIPFDLEFAPADAQTSYGAEVSRAFEEYSARIHQILVNGLAKHPRRLARVRNELMRLYAEAAIAAGTVPTKGESHQVCDDGKWSVEGICVDVPFRLVFRRLPDARPAPRPKKP